MVRHGARVARAAGGELRRAIEGGRRAILHAELPVRQVVRDVHVARDELVDVQPHAIHLLAVDEGVVRPEILAVTQEERRFPPRPVGHVQPRGGMTEGRIVASARRGVLASRAEAAKHGQMVEPGGEERFRRHHPFAPLQAGVRAEGVGRHPLVDAPRDAIRGRLHAGLQRDEMRVSAVRQSLGGRYLRPEVELRHEAVLDVILARPLGPVRQVLKLPHGCGRQPERGRGPEAIAYLRASVERLERRAGGKIQYVGHHVAEERVPRHAGQHLVPSRPVEGGVGLPDTQQIMVPREPAEIHLYLGGR